VNLFFNAFLGAIPHFMLSVVY